MKNEPMICGIDCHGGDANCNNYCNHDRTKPMADHPPEATPEMVYRRYFDRATAACAKAEESVEALRMLNNEQFTAGFIEGMQKLADSCERRREKLKLLAPRSKQ